MVGYDDIHFRKHRQFIKVAKLEDRPKDIYNPQISKVSYLNEHRP